MAEKDNEFSKFQGEGLNKSELFYGNKRFKEYQEKYSIGSPSDLSLLNELVFLEVIQRRYRQKVAELGSSKDVASSAIPSALAEGMSDNLKQMMALQERLGCTVEKKQDDPMQYIQQLQRKHKVWMEENQASRLFFCDHCGKANHARIRMDKYEVKKHPFFKDKILANVHLIKLYKEGKITKQDVALILNTTPEYTDWIISKWPEIANGPA